MIPRSILEASGTDGLWIFCDNCIVHRFSIMLMLPLQQTYFMCVYLKSSKWQNTFTRLDSSIRSMLEHLVLKNAMECTSQRLKRTSGARVMIIFGRSVARSLARSLGRSLDGSLARSLARSIARSLDRSLAPSLDRSLARSLARSHSNQEKSANWADNVVAGLAGTHL